MDEKLTEREEQMAAILRATTVALGCRLIREIGEEETAKVFADVMNKKLDQMKKEGTLGKGFKVLADMVSQTALFNKMDVSFDLENMIAVTKRCGLWEAGKALGYADTPLCRRCKANSDAVLARVLPGYKKKILESLWWGDDECYMIYEKDEE